MNPSSSSNADPSARPAFKVGLRELSPDLSATGVEHAARELGDLTAARLLEIAQKLAGLPTSQLIDSDPHFVVSARRGRFIIRPDHGTLRLFDATDSTRTFLELDPKDLPEYLNGTDLPSPVPVTTSAPEIIGTSGGRQRLVVGLFIVSVAMVIGSAYFTFRETNFDSDSEYSALPADQLAGLRRQVAGRFVTANGENARELTLRLDGSVTLLEHGPDSAVAGQRDDTYVIALQNGTTRVARTRRLGPIEIQNQKTLRYAGESYTLQP